MSKVDELKQRLQKVAYKGMVNRRGPQSFDEAHKGSISDTMADTIQEGFYEEETRKKILDRIDPTELPHKQEVTCGASSEHCLEDWENIIEDGQVGNVPKIKGVGGFYSGPGAEHSLNRLNLKSKEKEVGHTWLELPDKTIIDASAGQFIDPKHEPLKQRQRFRIIPKESGLHKYYKKDPLLTHRIERDFNDPDHHRARKLRKQGIDPFPSRKAKLKQRLAAIREAPKIKRVEVDWNDIMKRNLVNDQVVLADRSQWLSKDGNIYSSKKHPAGHYDGVVEMIMNETKTKHPYESDLGKYITDMDYLGNEDTIEEQTSMLKINKRNFPKRNTPIPERGEPGSGDYSTLDRFMKESGSLRLVGTSNKGHLSIEGNTELSPQQVKFLRQHNQASGLTPEEGLYRHFDDQSPDKIALKQLGYRPRNAKLKQRLAAIRESPKIKDVRYYDDPPVDKNYYQRMYSSPREWLEHAADGVSRKKQEAISDAHSNPSGSSDKNINRLAVEDKLEWVDYPKNKGIREMTNKEKIDLSMRNDYNYNVRGDELGGVEHYKRKLRRGEPIGEPTLTLATPEKNELRLSGHEGRHRARALMEEGVKKMPFKVVAYSGGTAREYLHNRKNLKGIEPERNAEKSDKDTRYPILGRYSKLKQRLAYTGGTKYDKQISKVQDNFQGMREDITGGPNSLRDHHSNIFDHQCTNEATCGKTSGKLLTNFIAKTGLSHKDVSIEGGLYKGPGGEYSPAVQKKIPSGEPQVKHEWLKLSDGTIIDGSSGQFMNQKNEIRQNQRFRVIRPSDPLYKSYEGKYSQSFAEMSGGRRNWYNKKDPMRRNWDKTRIQVHDTDKLRAGKLKQRLSRLEE